METTKKLSYPEMDTCSGYPTKLSLPVCPQQCRESLKGGRRDVTGGSHLCACGSHSPTSTWRKSQPHTHAHFLLVY